MRDEHVDDLIDLYALGALEPDEQGAVDQHLDECGRCRALLAQAKELVLLLAWTPDQHDPPPALRGRVLRRVEQLQRLDGDDARPWWQRFMTGLDGWTPRLSVGLAGAMAAVLLVVGLRMVRLQDEVQSLRVQLQEQQLVVDVLRSPDSRLVSLAGQPGAPGGRAQLLLDPKGRRAYLVTSELEPLAPEQTYQLWLIADNKPVSMGTFQVGDAGVARIVVQADKPLQQFQAVGVSIEPAGGSPQPTNVILLNQI